MNPYDAAPAADAECPHCGGFVQVDPVPPRFERAGCLACGLRSPLFERLGRNRGAALAWIASRAGAAEEGLVAAARRLVNAWDRQDADQCATLIEDVRRLTGRRVSAAPDGTPPR